MAVAVELMATVLLLIKILIPEQWVKITGWIITAYITGNVAQDVGYNWSKSYYNRNDQPVINEDV